MRTRSWAMPDVGLDATEGGPMSPISSAEACIPFQSSYGLDMGADEGQMQTRLSAAHPNMDFGTSYDDVWDFSVGQAWLDLGSPIPSIPASPPESLASVSLSLYNPSLVPALQCPDDKALLNHYSTIVASVLSRQADNTTNPFLSYIIPMTMSSELVLDCVLILSAKHWSRLQPQMGSRGAAHQSKATQSLANLLSHVDKSSVGIALLSCLLLCMAELLDGQSSKWKLHLEGAKRLVTTLRLEHHESLAGEYKFLIKLSRFLDSAVTTSTCKAPLINDNGHATTPDLDPSSPTPDDDDRALYGIPKQLFHIVDQVNRLADKRGTRVNAPSEEAFRLEAATVEDWLDRWSFEYGGPSRAVESLFPGSDDVMHATAAYEWALRLRLHQITEGYTLTDATVTQAVAGILDAVQKIRYGSPLEGCLLFPLVMAGGACDQLEHRVVIQDRLMVMERTCGFGYIYQARDLVERVWRRRDQADGGGARVNWARIRFAEMNGLVIF